MPILQWQGVFPAITTPFRPDLSIDHELLARHVGWLIESGVRGIVALSVTGEGASLSPEEKRQVLATVAAACAGRAPMIAGAGGLTTAEAVGIARAAADAGAAGIMVLPPWLYAGDWREATAHLQAVVTATALPCMLYNNPQDYGTDLTSARLAELAEVPNVAAVKESSGDVRRVTGIRELLGDRLAIFVGLDDLIVEGVQAGAAGWIAGLANALPRESVRLFDLARAGLKNETSAFYSWFLPLLRLNVHPQFVQLMKLVQAEVGRGTEVVRPPRLPLAGVERDAVRELVRERLARRPAL